jgi:ParB-like chromosome segregation protein Spo0J
MKDGGKVNIDLIEENPSYQERRSQWTKDMHSLLKDSFVRKAGTIRIIVKKTGNRYVLVAGHHLLKAARECGLKKAHVDVIGSEAERDYLKHFSNIINDYCRNIERCPETCARSARA